MNNCTFHILVFLFGLVLGGCTTAISPPPVGIETEKDVTLPLKVEKVWFRTEKVRLLGMSYEESGTVTVSENGVEFVYEKGQIKIPRESIQKVVWGKLSPDITNDWVIIYYASTDKDKVAAFKGALFSGGGKDSKIYSAILHIMKAK
ncbi:MAG: hypothetical protein ABL860_02140 [Candidatus Nitrotoga sp.]